MRKYLPIQALTPWLTHEGFQLLMRKKMVSLDHQVLWLKQVSDIKFQGSEQPKQFSMGYCGKHSS
jgi:hypothetical protein